MLISPLEQPLGSTMRIFSTLLAALFAVSIAVSGQAIAQDNNTNADTQRGKGKKETRAQKAAKKKAVRDAKKSGMKMTAEEKAAIEAKAAEEALLEEYKSGKKHDFEKEFEALSEAAAILAELPPDNEKEAAKAAKKIGALFHPLPIPLGGDQKELEMWATFQNKVNMQMERLMNKPYFESSGLQEAWTYATDPFSRRRADKTH